MNWITFAWAAAAGASAILGLTHLLIGLRNREARAEIAFAAAALSVAAIAVGELAALSSTEPAAFARTVRWIHVPLLFLVASLVGFVHISFGTGRPWLGLAAVGMRLLAFVLNFLSPLNLHFREIRSLDRVEIFGQPASVVGEATVNHWNRVAEVSSLLLLAYVVDASIRLWRRGGRVERTKAWVVGGSVVTFILLAACHGALIHLRIIEFPYILTVCFLAIIFAMAFQLSRDAGDAARLGSLLRESRDQMSLAASAADLALWDWNIPDNRIWVTEEGLNLYGVGPGEVVSFDHFLATVHTDDLPGLKAKVGEVLEQGSEFAHEYRIVRPDGQVRWFSARGRLERNGGGRPMRLRGVSLDITRRRLAEDEARRIVEAAPHAMLVLDEAMRVVRWNGQVGEIFGYGPEELAGMDLDRFLPERYRAGHGAMAARFLEAPSERLMAPGLEVKGLRRDGSEVPLEIGLSPLVTAEGRFVLITIADLTERRRAEAEAAEQREILAHLSRVSSLGLLSASLAHELNQPLGIILTNAQAAQRLLSRDEPDLDEVRAILDDIVREDRRAAEEIVRLRALLRRGKTSFETVRLGEVVAELLRLFRPDLDRRQVSVRVEDSSGVPGVVGDPVQIRQVVMNLLLNACDSVEGLEPSRRVLRVAIEAREEGVRLSVIDRGRGLPEDGADRVFEPFFTTKEAGLGVGLAMSRAIVEAHHGRLHAENVSGGGSAFHMDLPRDTKPAP